MTRVATVSVPIVQLVPGEGESQTTGKLCVLHFLYQGQQVNTLFTKQLLEAPGKEIEVITVNYAPGAVDAIHRHNAHAVVYVLEGEVEMQVRGGTLQQLSPVQVFYESPEDVHTVSRNASKPTPAKFVVFFIENEGAPILTPVH